MGIIFDFMQDYSFLTPFLSLIIGLVLRVALFTYTLLPTFYHILQFVYYISFSLIGGFILLIRGAYRKLRKAFHKKASGSLNHISTTMHIRFQPEVWNQHVKHNHKMEI